MGRLLALISSIVSLFTLSWVLCRWLQPVQCINSSLVGKVILESGAQPEPAVQQCSPSVRLFGAKISNLALRAQLPERLNKLEQIVPLLPEVFPIDVHIRQKLTRQLLITPGRVDISADLLMRPRVFEKALVFAQFPNESDFAAGVKSDFLLDENLWGVNRAAFNNRGGESWIENLRGLGNYCRSRNVIVAHQTYCDVHSQYGDSAISDEKLGATPWGLVPVFVRSLEGVYATLGFREKERALQNLLFLDEPQVQSIDDLSRIQSFDQANARFSEIMKTWLMPLMLNRTALNRAVKLATLPAHAPIRYMVVDRSSRDVFPIDKIEMGEMPTAPVLTFVQYGLNQYVVSSDITHRFNRSELMKNHRVERLVYVSCQIPEVENLLRFSGEVKRVLFVRQCAPKDISWSQAFTLGMARYLTDHPESEFMEFNLSALRLAQRLDGPLKHPAQFSNWGKWLKWQSVVSDDQEPSALRPLAAIEGVRRFRMY